MPITPIEVKMFQTRAALKKLDPEEFHYYMILSRDFKAVSSKELADEQKQEFTVAMNKVIETMKENVAE